MASDIASVASRIIMQTLRRLFHTSVGRSLAHRAKKPKFVQKKPEFVQKNPEFVRKIYAFSFSFRFYHHGASKKNNKNSEVKAQRAQYASPAANYTTRTDTQS